jgi:hypothetical protein
VQSSRRYQAEYKFCTKLETFQNHCEFCRKRAASQAIARKILVTAVRLWDYVSCNEDARSECGRRETYCVVRRAQRHPTKCQVCRCPGMQNAAKPLGRVRISPSDRRVVGALRLTHIAAAAVVELTCARGFWQVAFGTSRGARPSHTWPTRRHRIETRPILVKQPWSRAVFSRKPRLGLSAYSRIPKKAL